ncbi:hypothetical protein ACHWQZ_G019473 [Mnemiopsis leidyi]
MFVRLMELHFVFLLVELTSAEWFSNGEHSFLDLADQWEYLTKFAFTKNGNVEIVLKFKRPDSEDKVIKVAFYQMPVESWDSKVLSTSTCPNRLDMAQQSIELVVEEDRDTETERECFHYYDETVCKITKDINGNTEPWVFIALVYCDNKISDLELQWKMHATNGKSFLVKEVPVNDMGLYQAYLALTIISALLIVFWVFYYKEIKLNMRVAIPYKIALFLSLVGFALITGFYGKLHGTGYRNDSLFNSGFMFCMIAYVLIIQSSLSAVWSGSIMTVHLPRWKTILTIVIPIVFVISMMTIFTLHYVDVKQRDVYPFEQRSDRYLVWVVLGFSILIWLTYTLPIVMNIASKEDKISYLRILYLIISLYLLAVGGCPLIANFNMQTEKRKMFVLVCFGAAHLFNFFFLFICIKDNHTLKSIGHFWWVIFFKYMCCKFKLCPCIKCGGKNNGKFHANGGRSSPNAMYGEHGGRKRRGGCIGCCLSVCPCFICCPCCRDKDQGDRYTSETDLKKILVQNRNVDDFELKIVDMDAGEAGNKITPDTITESEPIVISNNTPEKETPAPSINVGKKPDVVVIDGFSDDEEQDQVRHDINHKVLPWLYHDKPTKDLSPRRRFSNAIVKTAMNVKDHGYNGGAPNHWTNGNHKPFATAENKPIVLYKRPDSDQLFSASQSSLDGGVRKPATFVPLKVFRCRCGVLSLWGTVLACYS